MSKVTGVHVINELIPSVSDYNADLFTYEMLNRTLVMRFLKQ